MMNHQLLIGIQILIIGLLLTIFGFGANIKLNKTKLKPKEAGSSGW